MKRKEDQGHKIGYVQKTHRQREKEDVQERDDMRAHKNI